MPLTLKEYYKKKEFSELLSITDLKWRHFRFMLKNGRFLKINRQIKNGNDLKRLILRHMPLDVYYSTSCYLDPTSVTARTEKNKYSTIIIYNDIVFDIDFSPVSIYNLNKARKEALKVIEFMKEFKLKYIAFSGSKGFHLVYEDNIKESIPDPLKREKSTIERRKQLVAEMKLKGIHIDSAITVDTRRIFRVPGTVNSKTGMVCSLITKEQLDSGMDKILEKVECVGDFKMRYFNLLGYFPKLKFWRKKNNTTYETHYATYINNSVLGIKNRYIPFIEYPMIKEQRALHLFEDIVKKYKLPNMIVFKVKEGYCGVCLKSMQKRELLKILVKTKSENINFFRKYRHNLLELDKSLTEKTSNQLKKPVAVINGSENSFFSKGHYVFFSKLCNLPSHQKLHGEKDVKLVYSVEKA
jgi:DNA primase catalytic subunit